MSKHYVWSGPLSGAWGAAGDWTDASTSQPASAPPGANDTATIDAPTAGGTQTITGSGSSSALTVDGDTLLAGTFSTGALTLGGGGGVYLWLQSGGSLSVSGDATLDTGDEVEVTGGSLTVTGVFSQGTLAAQSGGQVHVGGLNNAYASLDAASVFEVGAAGGAKAGVFTVDAGVTASSIGVTAPVLANAGTITGGLVYTNEVDNTGSISGVQFHALGDSVSMSFNNSGTFTLTGDWLPGALVNNGVVIAGASTTGLNNMISQVTGTGQIHIAAGGDLSTGTVGSGQTIAFTGAGGSLDLSSGSLDSAGVYDARISGFAAGDVIDYVGAITQATYNAGNGVLSLLNGSTVVAKLHLVGDYAGASFSATQLGGVSTHTLISVGGGGDTATAPAGTSTADQYVWSGPSPGSWDLAANWTDSSTSSNPAALAPGVHDLVTINSGTYQLPQVISGVGNSAQLTIGGDTVLTGAFSTGALDVVNSGAALTVQSGGSLNVSGDATVNSGLTAAGGVITIAGALAGGVTASGGGKVQVGALSGGAVLDSTSSIEVGAKGGAKAGVFTVDAGDTATLGSLDAPSVVNHGTITNAGGGHLVIYTGAVTNTGSMYGVDFHALNDDVSLSFNNSGTITLTGDWLSGPVVNNGVVIGAASTTGLQNYIASVTGTGQLQIAAGGELSTGTVGAGQTVAFTGAGGSLDIDSSSLDSAKTYDARISGFAAGDVVDYGGKVTQATYNAGNGVLSLLNGSTVVAKLHLVGDYAGASFSATPLAGPYPHTLISVGGGGDTATAPAGTSAADQYVWSGPSPGSWDLAANWTDTSTSSNPAAVAPGVHDSVTINSGTYQLPQVISGAGNSAQLTIGGDVTLSGKVSTGALSVSSGVSLTVQAKASLSVSGAASGAIGAAGGSIIVAGTETGGVSASSGGKIQLGALNGTGVLDSTSSMEVGTKGGAKAGAFTVDAGATATLGGLDAPAVVNHGTMTNAGGGHPVVYTGAVTNTGVIYGVDFHALNDSVHLSFNNSGTITLTGDWLPGALVDNGVVIAGASTTGLNDLVGNVTGNGQLQIATGGVLSTGTVGAGVKVAFTGVGGSLDISSGSLDGAKAYDAKISGFASGDIISYAGTVTQAVYHSNNGNLTLLNGTKTVATLHLVGDYAGDTFLVSSVSGASQISLGASPGLVGESSHQSFDFTALSQSPVKAPELISGFVAGDTIDLSAIDANTKAAGDQAFHFGATPGHTGDIVTHYDAAHGRTVIDLYVDANAKADAEIWLAGDHTLSAADFVL